MKHLKSETPQELANNFGNLFAPFGNTNIRGSHIGFLEKKITEHDEHLCQNLSQTPYYYSWLILFVEHIFWDIKQRCFFHDEQPHHLGHNYRKLINVFLTNSKHTEKYAKEDINTIHDITIEFLIIRMAHVHGGFPNAIPEELEKSVNEKIPGNRVIVDKDENEKFTKEQILSILNSYSNPSNFETVKEKFKLLYSFLEKWKCNMGI